MLNVRVSFEPKQSFTYFSSFNFLLHYDIIRIPAFFFLNDIRVEIIIHAMKKSPARQFVKVEYDFELEKIFN